MKYASTDFEVAKSMAADLKRLREEPVSNAEVPDLVARETNRQIEVLKKTLRENGFDQHGKPLYPVE